MARPKRVKEPKKGDRYEIGERTASPIKLELYANDIAYHGDQCCLSIIDGDVADYSFQTTLSELQLLLNEFKKVRGIKRVRRSSK